MNEKLLRALEDSSLIVLDVETKNVETFTGKELFGVGIGIPRGLTTEDYYILPEDLHEYKAALSRPDLGIIAHNIMFDAEIMLQNGVPLYGDWFDTMIMASLVNESELSFGLDSLARRYVKRGKLDMKPLITAFNGWNNIPKPLMEMYCKNDVSITWSLFLYLSTKMAEQDMNKLYQTYMKYLKALRSIQAEGIVVDWDKLAEKRDEAVKRMKKIRFRELKYDPASSTQLNRRLFQILKMRKISTTPTGRPKTDIDTLYRLRRMYKQHAAEIDTIIEFRQLQKANGNWYEGYERYHDDTGLIHPNFKVHGTKTGRLSCEAPNLQQIPREYSRAKCLFSDNKAASEILVEFDYSQIELRVGAFYAMKQGDDAMFKLYQEGSDVHDRTAVLVGAYDQIADRSEARQVGKTGNFLWIYGGGPKAMSYNLFRQFGFESTIDQCGGWTSRFHEAYPGFQRAIDRCRSLHKRDGYIACFNGRRRRIRERDVRGAINHRKAFNSRVQGGCGQLLMYAIIKLHRAIQLGDVDARIVNTVHDSIWVYIPEHKVESETEKIVAIMREMPERVFQLPFDVDAKPMHQGRK